MTDQAIARLGSSPAPEPLAFGPPAGSPFELHVQNLFRFNDGRTVFVGPAPNSDPHLITPERARHCALVVDEQVVQTITLAGEMMPRTATPGTPPPRAVYTFDVVRLDAASVRAHKCRLVDHAA